MELFAGRARRVLLLTVLGIALGLPTVVADARPTTSAALDADVPDPEILAVDGGLVAYSTNAGGLWGSANVPMWSWTDARGWQFVGDALPTLPAWTEPGHVWAPGVFEVVDGTFTLYFSTRHVASGRQCIGVARAPSAFGPFDSPAAAPMICQLDRGGSIDPSPFVATDGSGWLTWKSDDNAVGRPTVLWSAPVSATGETLTGPARPLLGATAPWEQGIIENPELVEAAGQTWLLYSGGRWDTDGYGIGWARCAGPAGPCRKGSLTGPWIVRDQGILGAGGASVVDTGETLQMALHGWSRAVGYRNGGHRALYTESIGFDAAGPLLRRDLRTQGRVDDRATWSTIELLGGPASLQAGRRTDALVACDLDGDGVDTPTSFRNGVWYRTDVPASDATGVIRFGRRGDTPLCADADGDGTDDLIVRRGASFFFRVGRVVERVDYGRAADTPVVGDFDGDGRADVGVVRGRQFLLRTDRSSGAATISFTFDVAFETPVVGDWDGNGIDDPGVRAGDAFILQLGHGGGPVGITVPLGSMTDAPVVGNWDGGPDDGVGVVR